MNLHRSQDTIIELLSRFVAQAKASASINRTDLLRLSQTVLIPLFAETYGFQHLENLDSVGNGDYPAIDLGDREARVAIQVTATSTSRKVKDTLERFMKYGLYEHYDRLIIYILTEKRQSYSGAGYESILQGRFSFDKDSDIWDYRNLLREISGFDLARSQSVERILKQNFENMNENRTLVSAAETHFRLGNIDTALRLYSQLLEFSPSAEFFIGRGKCYRQLAIKAHRDRELLNDSWNKPSHSVKKDTQKYQEERVRLLEATSAYEERAHKDFSDAIAIAESAADNIVARKARLRLQEIPLECRVTEWAEDIKWLKEHREEVEWGEVLYLEALSYGWDSILFDGKVGEIPNWQEIALACLDKAIALGYSQPEVYFLRAQAHHYFRNFGLALHDINEAVKADSEELLVEALNIKGNILTKLHRFEHALNVYQELRDKYRRSPQYIDDLWRIDELLFGVYALQSEFSSHEVTIHVQATNGILWAGFTPDKWFLKSHPKTLALLKTKLGLDL